MKSRKTKFLSWLSNLPQKIHAEIIGKEPESRLRCSIYSMDNQSKRDLFLNRHVEQGLFSHQAWFYSVAEVPILALEKNVSKYKSSRELLSTKLLVFKHPSPGCTKYEGKGSLGYLRLRPNRTGSHRNW